MTQLNVYDGASLSNDDILATINRWVTDNATRQASFSAGECELLAFATGFTDALDVTLAQAAAQGQSLFVSSGDTGVFCAGRSSASTASPPASRPSSTRRPRRTRSASAAPPSSGPARHEIGWYAGGGGISLLRVRARRISRTPAASFLGVNRGVPDVALDADPNSRLPTSSSTAQQETIGGTSASAPSWQGIWARVQSGRGGNLGFADPVLYAEPASAFNDITLGANGLPNTPGYDYVTGRGTPIINALTSG